MTSSLQSPADMAASAALRLPVHADAAAASLLRGSALRLRTPADRALALARWSALLPSANAGFFQSPVWLASWLEALPGDTPLWLLQADIDGRCVGVALVVKGPHRRQFGLPFVPAWHLHATGTPLDAICAEYNDLLVDRAHAGAARRVLIEQWLQLGRGARELHLNNLREPPGGQDWAGWLQPFGRLLGVQQHAKPSYAVDLQRVRDQGPDVLALCSANLRSQVRRTLRAYRELGALTLEAAPDVATALAWLDRLAALHQAHWNQRGAPGAFAHPSFAAFHRQLIPRCGTDPGQPSHVQLLRLRAGEQDIGYLYNFVHQGRVLFYQSGLDYELGGKHARPGYVAHLLAIEHNARLQHGEYDFLMGDMRYKRDLATHRRAMHIVVLQSGGWRFGVEATLRRIRHRLRERRAAPPA